MLHCIAADCLPGACGIVQSQYKGGEFVTTGDTVEGQACFRSVGFAYSIPVIKLLFFIFCTSFIDKDFFNPFTKKV